MVFYAFYFSRTATEFKFLNLESFSRLKFIENVLLLKNSYVWSRTILSVIFDKRRSGEIGQQS